MGKYQKAARRKSRYINAKSNRHSVANILKNAAVVTEDIQDFLEVEEVITLNDDKFMQTKNNNEGTKQNEQ